MWISWPAADLLGVLRCAGCGRASEALCPECRRRLRAPCSCDPVAHADRVLAPWAYEGAARALVLELKLGGGRAASRPLIDAMSARARRDGLVGTAVTWVPGRRRDIRRRGFDHAEVLARGVAEVLGLPVAGVLRRVDSRPDQTTLTAAERRRSPVGAFEARSCAQGVVLIDDLVTTGATASSCAAALRRAGAPSVEVVAPCRV